MLHELGVTQGWNFSVLSELELLGYHFGLLWVTFLKSFLCSFPFKFFLLLLKCDKDTKIPKIILQLCCLFFFFFSLFFIFIFFLILEEKFPLAFEKYKHCREFSSDSSFSGSQDISSTMFKTFTTACEGERSMEIPRLCPFGLKEPVSPKITY